MVQSLRSLLHDFRAARSRHSAKGVGAATVAACVDVVGTCAWFGAMWRLAEAEKVALGRTALTSSLSRQLPIIIETACDTASLIYFG